MLYRLNDLSLATLNCVIWFQSSSLASMMFRSPIPLIISQLVACRLSLAVAVLPPILPQVYPGPPSGDYSPAWQQCKCIILSHNVKFRSRSTPVPDFQVTEKLPGVDFNLSNSYAGNIGVQRPGHPNDTLFFWAFEHQSGSLTAAVGDNTKQPWAIWLQGGCGRHSGSIYAVDSHASIVPVHQAWSGLRQRTVRSILSLALSNSPAISTPGAT